MWLWNPKGAHAPLPLCLGIVFYLADHLAREFTAFIGCWLQSIPAVHELGGINTAVKRGKCSEGRKFGKLNLQRAFVLRNKKS